VAALAQPGRGRPGTPCRAACRPGPPACRASRRPENAPLRRLRRLLRRAPPEPEMFIVDTSLLLTVVKTHEAWSRAFGGDRGGELGGREEAWGGASTTDRSGINDLGGRREMS